MDLTDESDNDDFSLEDDLLEDAFSESDDEEDSSDTDDDDDADDEGDEPDDDASDDDDGEDESDESSDEDDDDEEEPEETPAERRAREAEEQLTQLREERERERLEAEAVQRGSAVVAALTQRKEQLDAADAAAGRPEGESWRRFQAELIGNYKDTIIQRQALLLRGAAGQQAKTREQQEEEEAFTYVFDQVKAKLKPTRTEELILLRSRTPEEFEEAVDTILDDRGERTRPAREARARNVRNQRRERGADRTGVRGGGGAAKPSKATKTFRNADEALDADFEDALSA